MKLTALIFLTLDGVLFRLSAGRKNAHPRIC